MKENRVIGIDIGGTNTVLALVDEQGNMSHAHRMCTKAFPNQEAYALAIARAVKELVATSQPPIELLAIGIGAPNGNFYTGRIEFAPNLPWTGIIDLGPILERVLKVPVVLTNDANAAALGEGRYGGAQGMKNFVEITIGTGLGSGIVINGQILHGHSGFAGELGHTTAFRNGRLCSCGKRGCLETYVSARGLKETLREILADGATNSPLRVPEVDQLSAQDVFRLAQQGDPAAAAAFEQTGEILGRHLSDTVAYLSPEAIFLFGGLANAGDLLLAPTQRHLEAHLLPIYRNTVALLPSQLNGKNVAILGASALAWDLATTNAAT